MPPLPDVAEVIRLEHGFSSTSGDLDIHTRIYFQYAGGAPNDAACATFLTNVLANFTPHIPALYNPDFTLTSLSVTDLSSPTGGFAELPTSVAGTRSGGAPPVNICALMNYTIARRYRGGKPRSYWPWGAAADLSTPREWSSTFVTACDGGYSAYQGAVLGLALGSASLVAQVNVSYYQGFTNVPYGTPTKYRRVPTLRPTPVVDDIGGFALNPIPGSQRKRFQRS